MSWLSRETWFDQKKRERREFEEQNREKLGVLLLRKRRGSEIICSASIVKVKSKVLPECEFSLLTSDVFPAGDIQMNDYYMEFWSSELKSVAQLPLSEVAQSSTNSKLIGNCYRSSGLVLIPTKPKKSTVCCDKRSFSTDYYDVVKETKGDIRCYIVGSYESAENSLPVKRFSLITNRDQEQLKFELHEYAADGTTGIDAYETLTNFKNSFRHLRPQGGVILKGEGKQVTCIGVVNFSPEGLLSPVFLTPETLTG